MYTFVLVIHFLACLVLILLVLMQSGKGSAAGIFGGSGGGDNLFASPTAFNVVNKATAVVACVLFITAISLTFMSGKRASASIADNVQLPAATQTTDK